MGKGRCGGDEDEDETDAYDPSDKGPNSKRGCTDVPCLLLLVALLEPGLGSDSTPLLSATQPS